MRIALEVIIIAAIVVACFFGVKSYRKRLSSGCCGSGDGSGKVKKIKVKDKDKKHYPYEAEIKVDGMVCANCANRVENALNSVDGAWATVDLEDHTAKVLLKSEVDPDVLRQAVNDTGTYTALSVVGPVKVA